MAGSYSDWADLTLCDSTDLQNWQFNVFDFADFNEFWAPNILLAKNEIKKRIWALYPAVITEEPIVTTYPTDYLVNPEILKEGCVFLTLCLGFKELVQFAGNDQNQARSDRFCQRFEKEWYSIRQFLQVDINDDAVLEESNPLSVLFQAC